MPSKKKNSSNNQQQKQQLNKQAAAEESYSSGYSSSEYESDCCDDPNCAENIKKQRKQKGFWGLLKKYYKYALILCLLLALNEELTNKSSWLNSNVRFFLDQPTLAEFLVGNVKGMGHLKEDIAECPLDISLKELMVNIITDYQPCIFRGLANDWNATQKWKDKEYLNQAAGKTLINVEKKQGPGVFAYFERDIQQQLMPFSEYLQIYDTYKKGRQDYHYYFDHEAVPESLLKDIKEPEALSQLLKVEDITFQQNYLSKQFAHTEERDSLQCVVQGHKNFTLVSAWERLFVYPGFGGMPTNFSPVDFKQPDFRMFENFRYAQKYQVNLQEGDCLYIPPYWWYQADFSTVPSLTVTYWYQLSSKWLKTVFTGLEDNHI